MSFGDNGRHLRLSLASGIPTNVQGIVWANDGPVFFLCCDGDREDRRAAGLFW